MKPTESADTASRLRGRSGLSGKFGPSGPGRLFGLFGRRGAGSAPPSAAPRPGAPASAVPQPVAAPSAALQPLAPPPADPQQPYPAHPALPGRPPPSGGPRLANGAPAPPGPNGARTAYGPPLPQHAQLTHDPRTPQAARTAHDPHSPFSDPTPLGGHAPQGAHIPHGAHLPAGAHTAHNGHPAYGPHAAQVGHPAYGPRPAQGPGAVPQAVRHGEVRGARWGPLLPAALAGAAALVLAAGVVQTLGQHRALFPGGTTGWSLALLTAAIVGYLVVLGRDRWWGGTGSGAALTLAVLLLYGWVPAGLVSLAVVVLVGSARRRRWRQGVLHGAADILGIAAAALTLAVLGEVPTVEQPWQPVGWDWGVVPQVVLAATVYLLVTRLLLWAVAVPQPGRMPSATRTALVRLGLACGALLGIAPLMCVVALALPVLMPLFAVPLIALDSTLWIARARAEEQLRDPLTGLPNRQWLLERARPALEEAESVGTRSALVLIDMDRFRSVNDTLGHLAGDRLLLQIADRLRRALPRGAEAARLGGDEFAVLLPRTESATSAQRIARHLVAELGSPLDLDGLTLVLEASAGVAVFPDHALDAEGLLRRADVAMYQAKRDRSGVEVYESKRDSNTPDRLGLLGDLRRALDAGDVELHYQPKVRFDGQVAGLEALVRWVHPERGRVPPDEFIAIAESSGLMPHLTEYVLETALAQVARWRAQGLDVPVAVNVSPRDVHTPGFAGAVAGRLARHGVPAGSLQLEITEHVLLEDPQRAADTLAALTGHGVKMSLDDFGTGYSSLVHLRRLPVSELKIDRSFVARLAVDTEDAEIVRCTIDLAHSLGLLVVAEGVEDDETWERLRDLRCDAVQGWLVAAAMPPEEATAWLLARGSRGWQRPAELAAAAEAVGMEQE